MPHEWCQQSGSCWLKSFSQLESIPVPKFGLGEFVRIRWIHRESQEEFFDRGQVIGLTFSHNQRYMPGWHYFIRTIDYPSSPWIQPGYTDELHESEIETDISVNS